MFFSVIFTGCRNLPVGELLGDVTEVENIAKPGISTVGEVLSELNYPDLQPVTERKYYTHVTRQIMTAKQDETDKTVIIIKYSVDNYFISEISMRNQKYVVLVLNDNTISKDSIIEDLKFFGIAYYVTGDRKKYYLMSEKELKMPTNFCEEYCLSEYSTGQMIDSEDVSENFIIQEQTSKLIGNISEVKTAEDSINTLGKNGFLPENENVYPKVVVKHEILVNQFVSALIVSRLSR
ncbi:MAG: hypothetical protein ACI4NE_04080 [Succinivibrio sp.]